MTIIKVKQEKGEQLYLEYVKSLDYIYFLFLYEYIPVICV